MKIAAIQMVSSPDVPGNLAQSRALAAQAAERSCELVAFPEYFCFMGHRDTDKLALAEHQGDGPIQTYLSHLARELGLWVVGGTVPLKSHSPDRARNSSLVFDPQGECVARYDKLHLFAFNNGREFYDEGRVLEPGDQAVHVDVPSRDGHTWRVGLSVCYDLRFPELYRTLDADVLLVPSAFTYTTGQAHWETLLRARAIENLAYVAAPAQGGHHVNGRNTWGHTMIVSPWGELLASQDEGPAVVCAELSWNAMQQRRAQLPALSHRRTLLK